MIKDKKILFILSLAIIALGLILAVYLVTGPKGAFETRRRAAELPVAPPDLGSSLYLDGPAQVKVGDNFKVNLVLDTISDSNITVAGVDAVVSYNSMMPVPSIVPPSCEPKACPVYDMQANFCRGGKIIYPEPVNSCECPPPPICVEVSVTPVPEISVAISPVPTLCPVGIKECPAPPPNCNYMGADSCTCGQLICSEIPTVVPEASPTAAICPIEPLCPKMPSVDEEFCKKQGGIPDTFDVPCCGSYGQCTMPENSVSQMSFSPQNTSGKSPVGVRQLSIQPKSIPSAGFLPPISLVEIVPGNIFDAYPGISSGKFQQPNLNTFTVSAVKNFATDDYGNFKGFSGKGVVVTLNFTALTPGKAEIKLAYKGPASSDDSNITGYYASLPVSGQKPQERLLAAPAPLAVEVLPAPLPTVVPTVDPSVTISPKPTSIPQASLNFQLTLSDRTDFTTPVDIYGIVTDKGIKTQDSITPQQIPSPSGQVVKLGTTTTDAYGNGTITLDGSYIGKSVYLFAQTPSYLSKAAENSNPIQIKEGVNPRCDDSICITMIQYVNFGTLTAGDIYQDPAGSKDDIINSFDLTEMFSQWGWGKTADLNGDGTINNRDLAILFENYGKKGDLYQISLQPIPINITLPPQLPIVSSIISNAPVVTSIQVLPKSNQMQLPLEPGRGR